jgi:hypothetical protein
MAFMACASIARAIDLDVSPVDVRDALTLAGGPKADRAAFHKPYVVATPAPTVESIEIITEFRRLVKIAEERIADGDPFFVQNMIAVQEAMAPFRKRVSIIAHLQFHPLNTYAVGPPVDVSLLDVFAELPRDDLKMETLFGLASGKPGQPLPVVGARAEAIFDATIVGQRYRTVLVRLEGKDVARVTVDFGRLE